MGWGFLGGRQRRQLRQASGTLRAIAGRELRARRLNRRAARSGGRLRRGRSACHDRAAHFVALYSSPYGSCAVTHKVMPRKRTSCLTLRLLAFVLKDAEHFGKVREFLGRR